jgi:hypothetical protein
VDLILFKNEVKSKTRYRLKNSRIINPADARLAVILKLFCRQVIPTITI